MLGHGSASGGILHQYTFLGALIMCLQQSVSTARHELPTTNSCRSLKAVGTLVTARVRVRKEAVCLVQGVCTLFLERGWHERVRKAGAMVLMRKQTQPLAT